MNDLHWWIIFPLFGMGYGFFCMWLRYKRRTAELELLQSYVNQGKDLPPELLNILRQHDNEFASRPWRKATIFGSLACGFAIVSLLLRGHDDHSSFSFMIPAIIFGCLSLGWVVQVLVRAKFERQ